LSLCHAVASARAGLYKLHVLVVVNLAVERPAWALPPELLAKLRDSFPEVEFHWNQQKRDYYRRAAEAEVIWGLQLSSDIFQLAAKLKWFHSYAAGVRESISPGAIQRKLTITNSSVVHAPVVSEHALAMLFSHFRRLGVITTSQHAHRWGKDEYSDGFKGLRSFDGMTCGIFGYGAIGSRLASILKAMGSRVFVYRRNLITASHADAVFTNGEYERMLAQCDLVLNTLPDTAGTEGFFNADKFRIMKQGAVFESIGRGGTVDERALALALGYDEKLGKWAENGWLSWAILDVFAQEPLPQGSPLWSAPNVTISPHVASVSPGFWPKECALFAANLRRYLNGEPLHEQVNLEAGY
jgi:D-2-hydroxyacid dehydrogenase (NADP+)